MFDPFYHPLNFGNLTKRVEKKKSSNSNLFKCTQDVIDP